MINKIKIKTILVILLFVNIVAFGTSSSENKIAAIKTKIGKFEKIKESTQREYGTVFIKKIILKTSFYARFADCFRPDTKIFDNYARSLKSDMQREYREYYVLKLRKQFEEQLRTKELVQAMTLGGVKKEDLEKQSSLFSRLLAPLSETEITRLNALASELKNSYPERQLAGEDGVFLYYKFEFLFQMNCTMLEQIFEKENKLATELTYSINELKAERKQLTSNKEEAGKIDSFIKTIPPISKHRLSGLSHAEISPEISHYYRIKAFQDNMDDPESKEVIKEQLKKHIALRKAIIPLFVRNEATRGDIDRFVEKYESQLDYNDFDKYWPALEKISKNLIPDLFTSLGRPNLQLYTAEQIENSKLAARCYLECFFTPYLDLNNK
ncbi:MAG: hypothetical protein A2020_02405 [Lentisphaerae bacterium GWF2_45_14]|nr:MAG: hypothetical protein A2020_02405 [Lentisphaerae bacterium GWF2_45_14]